MAGQGEFLPVLAVDEDRRRIKARQVHLTSDLESHSSQDRVWFLFDIHNKLPMTFLTCTEEDG